MDGIANWIGQHLIGQPTIVTVMAIIGIVIVALPILYLTSFGIEGSAIWIPFRTKRKRK